jgi:hypothetical protein
MTFLIRRAVGYFSRTCFVVAALGLLAICPAQATFRQPLNGRIAIDLGPSFTRTNRFSGFVDESARASIAVIDLPADAYDKLKVIPESEENLANEGFAGTQKAELKGRKDPYIYLVGPQKRPTGDVTKFVLIFRENDVTGLIVADVSQSAIDAGIHTRESMEAILASATVRDAPPDPNEVFLFGYLGPFKQALDDGGMTKAFNLSGAQPNPGENQLVKEPMLLVSSSIHGDAIDVKAQANDAFKQLGGTTERRIDDEREVTVANLKGHQITGEVTDAASGNKITIRLVLLSGAPFGYFMFLGSMPAADRDKMLPEIEKVIASFELVR